MTPHHLVSWTMHTGIFSSTEAPYHLVSVSTMKTCFVWTYILLFQTILNRNFLLCLQFFSSYPPKLVTLERPSYMTFILKGLCTQANKISFITWFRYHRYTCGSVIPTVFSLIGIFQASLASPNHSVPTKTGAVMDHKMSLQVSQQPLYKRQITFETRVNCQVTIPLLFPRGFGQVCRQTPSALISHHQANRCRYSCLDKTIKSKMDQERGSEMMLKSYTYTWLCNEAHSKEATKT